MDYDLRTCDGAYNYICKFMNMTLDEYLDEWIIKCKNDFEIFWRRNIDRISKVDISNLRIMAFHVVGSLDGCKEIKSNGLINLQEVLSTDTLLRRLLCEVGIEFDIPGKTVCYNGTTYDIDYKKYRNKQSLSPTEKKLSSIAHRVYYDFCVNGFLLNDNVFDYGTNIHERPEFLMKLSHLFPQARELENYWKCKSKGYRVDFYATIEQISRFTFNLDELNDPPYEEWIELGDDMKIKKWLLSYAIERASDGLSMEFLYIKDNVRIPPNQIIEISEL